MAEYTGPIPTTPTATSTDQQWQNWWTYQTVLTNLRYEEERAARNAVLDAQHAQKMAAEAACAASNNALAAAQQVMAAAIAIGDSRKPTKADLVFALVKTQPQATIMTNSTLINGATGIVEAFLAKFPDAVAG